MSRKQITTMVFLIAGWSLVIMGVIAAFLNDHESPQDAYERGKIDGQLTDSTMPYVTMGIAPPSEIITKIIDDDTLYFWKQKVDTGYVLKPLYRVHRTWTPEDSMESWEYKEWFDTSSDWYGWDVSESLARSWYYGTDSTDTMPAMNSATKKEE